MLVVIHFLAVVLKMIKTCSLDFINNEFFDTDIMSSNGTVLFSATDKVTPEILLRLYFKEIYITEAPALEKVASSIAEPSVAESLTAEEQKAQRELALAANVKTSVMPNTPELNLEMEEPTDTTLNQTLLDSAAVSSSEVPPSPGFSDVGQNIDVQQELTPGIDLDGPVTANAGPIPPSPALYDDSTQETTDKGPKLSDVDKWSDSEIDNKKPVNAGNISDKVEPIVEEEVDKDLTFDEDKANKIADYSVALGKVLKFPNNRLAELRQAAYYHNIGRIRFKQSDLKKRGFRKQQALASFDIILNEKNLPQVIAETAKFCVNNYISSSFSFEGEIPYHHIVAITSYYAYLQDQGYSKEESLAKMLQLGGNKFNIFVLHKYLKIMRDEND